MLVLSISASQTTRNRGEHFVSGKLWRYLPESKPINLTNFLTLWWEKDGRQQQFLLEGPLPSHCSEMYGLPIPSQIVATSLSEHFILQGGGKSFESRHHRKQEKGCCWQQGKGSRPNSDYKVYQPLYPTLTYGFPLLSTVDQIQAGNGYICECFMKSLWIKGSWVWFGSGGTYFGCTLPPKPEP